jgi:hypothetical protein
MAAPQVNYPNNLFIDEPFMDRMSRDLNVDPDQDYTTTQLLL